MGGEEEIVRIAKRLDKMVAKKSAVSGGPPPHIHTALQWGEGSFPQSRAFLGWGGPCWEGPPCVSPSILGLGALPAAHLQAVF